MADYTQGEEKERLSAIYHVYTEPVLLILDTQGNLMHRMEGKCTPSEMMERLRQGLDTQNNLAAQEEKYIRGNRSSDFLIAYLETLHVAGLTEQKLRVLTDIFSPSFELEQLKEPKFWDIFVRYNESPVSREGCYVFGHREEFYDLFGKDAVVALYTSAAENQTQSMAYSTDNGKTFTKYEGNPIITSTVPDFRDPHMFWNEDIKKWNMILAAGQHMEIYTSDNLKDWKLESSFGEKYGNHGGVWECPDLMKLKVRGTDKEKWMLICNINPGGPSGGSATQYFVGDFDGYKFTCESKPEVTKWMDYGKDHYATVTFDNAPEGRHVAIAWMSNWQYATQVPTQQYRSGNSIPRDLGLFEYKGETYCSVVPSPEMTAARSKKAGKKLTESCEMVVNLKGNATITLSNDKGEKVVMNYDAKAETFSMDRTKSGKVDFSKDFAAVTKAPTYGKISQLRIFIDKSSIEALDADGKMSMTNLVFPSKPYNKVTVKGKGKYQVYDIM